MVAGSIFLSGMLILLIFNWMYIQTTTLVNTIILSSLVSLLAGIILLGVITGITVFGTGLDSASIKILFGAGALMNILFQIPLGVNWGIGLGLINNMVNAFSIEGSGFGIGIGYFLSGSISIMIFISGIMLIQGSGD